MSGRASGNPFVGLRPFESQETHLFFGREEQTVELLQRLHDHRFVAVVGGSGTGKSSLVRAGLIPTIKAGFLARERDRWEIAVMKPGDSPLSSLAAALLFLRERDYALQKVERLRESIEVSGQRAVEEFLSAESACADSNTLLLVDQFEEIFRFGADKTSVPQEEAADFVSIILDLADRCTLPVYVVMTMRSDFIGDCDAFHGLPEALNKSQYLVPSLTRSQLRSAIEGPVKMHRGDIERSLVDRILNEAGEARDRLPVMQHALMRTWQVWQDGGNGSIRHRHYEAAGTLANALSKHAEEALEGMEELRLRLTETMFRALTDTDASNRRIRRPAYLSEVARVTDGSREEVLDIVRRFQSDGRSFIICNETKGGDLLLDISHESLIRQWGTLRDWVDAEKRSRDEYLRVVDAATRYHSGKGGVLRDPDLQLALKWRENEKPSEAWAQRHNPDFKRAMRFLEESEGLREREGRERVRRRWLSIGAIILGVTALAGWFISAQSSSRASSRAESRRLALHAQSHIDEGELDVGLLLGLEAYRSSPSFLPTLGGSTFEARSVLLAGLQRGRYVDRYIRGHEDVIESVAFSPDGVHVASAGRDRTIRLWNLKTGKLVKRVGRADDWIYSIAFSPDGRLVSGGRDGRVQLWDLESDEPFDVGNHDAEVVSVSFSPDGHYLASGSWDSKVIVWSVEDGSYFVLDGHEAWVLNVAFSSDGKLLASGSRDSTLILWDVEERKPLLRLTGHEGPVQSIAFNPEGDVLASGSQDGSIIVWDLETREQRTRLSVGAAVQSIGFSPDGKYLVAGGDEKTIHLWDWKSGGEEPLAQFIGHQSLVQSVRFSPDGTQVASGGWDEKVILWDPGATRPLFKLQPQPGAVEELPAESAGVEPTVSMRTLAVSPDGRQVAFGTDGPVILWDRERRGTVDLGEDDHSVSSVGFSKNGRFLASASFQKEILVWDVERRRKLRSFPHDSGIEDVAVSSDGKLLAAGSGEKVMLWNIETGAMNHREHEGHVLTVAFSPDGSVLASGSDAGEILLWEIATGTTHSLSPGSESVGWVSALGFSHDGEILASALDSEIVLWDLDADRQVARLLGHEAFVQSIAFAPDNRRLASGGLDSKVLLWDLESRRMLGQPFVGHAGPVESVAFSPDGSEIVSGSLEGTIRTWDVSEDSWVERACSIANGNLAEEEWARIFGPDEPFRATCRNGTKPEQGIMMSQNSNSTSKNGSRSRMSYRSSASAFVMTLLLGRPVLAQAQSLLQSAREGDIERLQQLIAEGADVNQTNADGETALIVAAKHGWTHGVRMLLVAGAAVDAANKAGSTALILAASDGHRRTAELLIGRGADVDMANHAGDTALIVAVKHKHASIAKLLIPKVEDLNAKNDKGETALSWAMRNGNSELEKLLREESCD